MRRRQLRCTSASEEGELPRRKLFIERGGRKRGLDTHSLHCPMLPFKAAVNGEWGALVPLVLRGGGVIL